MKNKLALFESLAPNRIAVTVKEEHLHLISFAINKDIQIAVKRIVVEMILNQRTETVIAFAHIGRCCAQPDTYIAFREKHEVIALRFEAQYLR